ncbi:unannotated protein [freshwater metagenome]|uniref:Unannotated protein n=1 Tax=freshwater metagenome TaxID=449393 RepID=A0A6J7DEB0_9ZZZZ
MSPFIAASRLNTAGRSMNTTWFCVTLKSCIIVGAPTVMFST